ncbi:MAG: DinB family protein [Planctomycetota bacterium]|nr:DinB family protein [Planctomycetota bacterium]
MDEAARPVIEFFRAMETGELVERFVRGTERLDRRVLELSDAEQDTFFREEAGVGRWSCRVLVGHLADADIVFVHRMRRMVAEENPVLAAWDEDAFLDAGLYQPRDASKKLPVAGSVAMIHTARLWCGDWLRTLEAAQFGRRGLHPQRGEQTVRVVLEYATWHLEHHGWYLRKKVEKLRGG